MRDPGDSAQGSRTETGEEPSSTSRAASGDAAHMPGLCRITDASEKRRWNRHHNEEAPAYSYADARRFLDADGAKPGFSAPCYGSRHPRKVRPAAQSRTTPGRARSGPFTGL